MTYTTKFTRSTAKHRIANVYQLNYTLVDIDGHKKSFKKKLIVPWAIYSSCSSCSGESRLKNALRGCVWYQAEKLFGEKKAAIHSCSFNYELLDRIDEKDSYYKLYNEFAGEEVFAV